MSARFPTCIVCRRPGIPIGVISGVEVTVCHVCAGELHDRLEQLLEAMGGAPAPAPKRKRMGPEEFKEALAKAVEEKGQVNVIAYAQARGVPKDVAREAAAQLASERGWVIEEGEGRLSLRVS